MTRHLHRLAAGSAACWLLMGAGLARAQPAGVGNPTPAVAAVATDVVARRLFLAGREAFVRGAYEDAERLWERAFALSGRAALLLNLSVVRERLGRYAEAARALRDYLWLEPRDRHREDIERRIAALERRVALRAEVRWRGWPMWSAAGASVALGAGAALATVLAEARYAELASSCGSTPRGCPEEEIASVASRVTWARVLLGLSLASAATAVTFWVLGADQEEGEQLAAEVRP